MSDPRPFAQMIKEARERGGADSINTASARIALSIYKYTQEMNESDYDFNIQEAREYLDMGIPDMTADSSQEETDE